MEVQAELYPEIHPICITEMQCLQGRGMRKEEALSMCTLPIPPNNDLSDRVLGQARQTNHPQLFGLFAIALIAISREGEFAYTKEKLGQQDVEDCSTKNYTIGNRVDELFCESDDENKLCLVRIVYDKDSGRSRGFGFVIFSNEDDAKCAKEAMDGKALLGRPLRISIALEKARGVPVVVPRLSDIGHLNRR
ncbi:hypothetical protein V8G54_004504 [Vigna mungo]|uniref:RRM domain-containing protein n=1 Tax=Vigna mungo TaxID=3915 RepID=A0AAQ3PED2_VIGMU